MIQKHIVKRGKRFDFPQVFHTKGDETLLAAWRLELEKIRRVFDVYLIPFSLTIINFPIFRPNSQQEQISISLTLAT